MKMKINANVRLNIKINKKKYVRINIKFSKQISRIKRER